MEAINQMAIIGCQSVLVGYGLFKTTLVKIRPNHLGLSEHIIKGRFIEKKIDTEQDQNVFRYTLPKPLTEGWHLKNPLHKIHEYDQGTQKLTLDNVEFQTKGGSIFVSGVIVYRVSSRALFRVLETKDTMPETIKTEVNSILTKAFVSRKINTAIGEIGEIGKSLMDDLMRFPDPEKREDSYYVNKEKLRRMEVLCGIEIVSATLERPEPSAEIKEERDKIAVENYQTIAKGTERIAKMLDRMMDDIFKTNPNLSAILTHQSQVGELPDSISYRAFHTDSSDETSSMDINRAVTMLETLKEEASKEQTDQIAKMLVLIKTMGGKK